ncbi:MAG: Ig-like domain repeat protein, partial [Chthonomonadales bacterium]|nr:Ig-like domain repeat protein [Chthonomonadales bacterium]
GTLTAQTWATKMSGVDRTGPIASYRILKAWLWKMDNTPIPGKSILFKLDGTVLGSDNTRPAGYAQIGYTIADGAGAGVRTIRAEWAGDGGYLPSNCTNKLTVTKATPYIWVMPRTVPQGGIARFYAYFRRLPDYQKQAGKTLSFKIDGTWIVDVVTLSGAEAGIARYNYTTVESVGNHTLRAEFAGDAWVDAGYGEALLRIY